jgi:hypothetical protein
VFLFYFTNEEIKTAQLRKLPKYSKPKSSKAGI